MKYNEDGLIRLRNAVIENAAKEYIQLKRLINRHPEKEKLHYGVELNNLKSFFLSRRYELYGMSVSGEYMLRKLDEMAEGSRKIAVNRLGREHKKHDTQN